MLIAVPSTILFVLGLLALVFSVRGIFPWSSLSGLIFLGLGLGPVSYTHLDVYKRQGLSKTDSVTMRTGLAGLRFKLKHWRMPGNVLN